uniref:Uncharacterized protein n=1 Tax=Anguilla anguilla TaxID=7936 RepID=A0A0E9SQX5_ANGAN
MSNTGEKTRRNLVVRIPFLCVCVCVCFRVSVLFPAYD